jgi:hypothetical protein
VVVMMMVVAVHVTAGRIGQEERAADERGSQDGQEFFHWRLWMK